MATNDLAEELSMPEVFGSSVQRALLLCILCPGKEDLIPGSGFTVNLPGGISMYRVCAETIWVCPWESTLQLITIRNLLGQKLDFLRDDNSRGHENL